MTSTMGFVPKGGPNMHNAPSSRRLAIVLLAVMISVSTAHAAVVDITSCRTLGAPNTTYRLTQDIAVDCTDVCLHIVADRVTLDLQGHTVSTTCRFPTGLGIFVDGSDLAVVKNGTLSRFSVGVELGDTTRATVSGITADASLGNFDMTRGSQNLLKSCSAKNGGAGISVSASDRFQIEQCEIAHNSFFGLQIGFGSTHGLVTRNTILD